MLVDNIQRLCKEKGASLKSLERETGIGNGVIARWAHGSPRVDSLRKVADYFGVTIDELLKEDTTNDQNQTA